MNDFKDFALELHEKGIKATMDNARTFVLGNYDRVLPAYWLNPDARIKALYALRGRLRVVSQGDAHAQLGARPSP